MTLLDETFPFIQRNIECRRSSRSRWRGIVSVCCRIDKETDGTINIWLVETHSIIRIEHNFRRGQSETLAMASELRILSMPPEFLIKNYENFRQVEFLLANSFNEFSKYPSLHTGWYSYLQRVPFENASRLPTSTNFCTLKILVRHSHEVSEIAEANCA